MIRKATPEDKELYMQFTDAFYHSEAVLHPVPDSHREATWAELMRSNDYAECFFIDKDGLTIEDCENFSRAIDPIIDEADPIEKRRQGCMG